MIPVYQPTEATWQEWLDAIEAFNGAHKNPAIGTPTTTKDQE